MCNQVVLPRRFSGLWLGLLIAALVTRAPTAGALAQEPQVDPDTQAREDPYQPVIDLRKVDYIPAESAKSKRRTLRLTFNVATDVPKGTKINFELLYNALPFESTNFVLEGQSRRGVSFEWSPKNKLAVDEYLLRVRVYPADQKPEVRKAIERKPKQFPKGFEPWPWFFSNMPITVGTKAEALEQKNAICDLYGKFMGRLVASYAEFHELMDKVKAGEEAVNGKSLDEKKFEKLVADWRNKQGKLQEEIQNLVLDFPAFATKTPTAYRYLSDLGRMVSKAALNTQKEVTKQYGVREIRPKKVSRFFNGSYRWAASKEQLNGQLDKIQNLVCGHLMQEEPKEEAAPKKDAGAAKGADAKKDADAKSGEKEGGTTGKPSSRRKASGRSSK